MPDGTFTVVELVEGIRTAVTARFADPVWVEGEIASISRGRNGHVWFDLVERDGKGAVAATLPVVLWSSVRAGVNAQLKRARSVRMDDGVRIRIAGPLDVWVPGGRLQLQMQAIDPAYTLGLLASERDRVLRTLEAAGLLGRQRDLALPAAPRRIGLVTAAGSAAEADVLQTLVDSALAWEVVLVDARVQGADSERSVAAALLTAAGAGVDLVALVRGGGARTDLATFDHELVARTIAGMSVPVLTGIGHEIDTSVADAVAHAAHKTPTACAAAIVGLAASSATRVEAAWRDVARSAERQLGEQRNRVADHADGVARCVRARIAVEASRTDAADARTRRAAPKALVRATGTVERAAGRVEGSVRAHVRLHGRALDAAASRLATAGRGPTRRAEAHLSTIAARVGALDPARTMARGWSITRTEAGTVVRRTSEVRPGSVLLTSVADGTITSTVADTDAPPSREDTTHAR